MNKLPAFGNLLACHAEGFGYLESRRCFVRITLQTTAGRKAGFLLEVLPATKKPPKNSPVGMHYIWWQTEYMVRVVGSIPALKDIFAPKKSMQFIVNDLGAVIEGARDGH